jgi:hypothetical protein
MSVTGMGDYAGDGHTLVLHHGGGKRKILLCFGKKVDVFHPGVVAYVGNFYEVVAGNDVPERVPSGSIGGGAHANVGEIDAGAGQRVTGGGVGNTS